MPESDPTPVRHVILGTAGHVDHGKTRLVARLTGIDTDRLPEEKSRGISIDLGFAHWEQGGVRFGVVDVPGHERFVRNMVAGASGIDVGLLVVAAADGVMPQTREHLDVMQLLGVRAGIVAVTKTDLVDEETVALVREELGELLAGTFLEGAEVVPVSVVTGEGVARLERALVDVATGLEGRRPDGPFRLPVDRAFTLHGHGTVVAGSPLRGTVHPGDQLELLPNRVPVRVRSVQTHGESRDVSGVSTRTALNLAGLPREQVERGMEIATPGFLEPTRRLVVRLQVLATASRPVANRDEHRLHLGTSEQTVRVVLRDDAVQPGQAAFAELRTREPVVAEYGQRFLIRRASPATTIAGGVVLDPCVPDRTRLRDLDFYATALASNEPLDRLDAQLSRLDLVSVSDRRLLARTGLSTGELREGVRELERTGCLVPLTSGDLVHRDRLAAVRHGLLRSAEEEIRRRRPLRMLPRETLLRLGDRIAPQPVVEAAICSAVESGELVQHGEKLGIAGYAPDFSKRERDTYDAALAAVVEAGMSPPTLRELATLVGCEEKSLQTLLSTAEELGELVRVSAELWLPPAILGRYVALCEDKMNQLGSVTLSNLRETWGVTRKWAVPVAEHLDTMGVTVREGDVRRRPTGRDT